MTKKRYKKLMRAYWTRIYTLGVTNQSPYIVTKSTINKIIKLINTQPTRYCATLTREKIIEILGVRDFLSNTDKRR